MLKVLSKKSYIVSFSSENAHSLSMMKPTAHFAKHFAEVAWNDGSYQHNMQDLLLIVLCQ